MKFTIYAKNEGGLHPLYRIARTGSGLYFDNVRNKSDPSYLTYHEDGAYWTRLGRSKTVKKRRPALSDLRGAYTLSVAMIHISPHAPGIRPGEVIQLRDEDIVVEYSQGFAVELILSETIVNLEPSPSRLDSTIFVKDGMSPVMIIEFFRADSNIFPQQRFASPPTEKMTFDKSERI